MRTTQRRSPYLLMLFAGMLCVLPAVAESFEQRIADALQRSLDRSDYAIKRQTAGLRDVSDEQWQGFRIDRGVEEWRRLLTPDQYRATREKIADEPFAGTLVEHDDSGIYHCVCGNPLFHSEHKQASQNGFPRFRQAVAPAALVTDVASLWSQENEQVDLLCGACGAHLGHVDPGETPDDPLSFQVNSSALVFQPAATQGD